MLALDVIEHLDDDRSAVPRLAERVAPGRRAGRERPGPARAFGEFDAIQGHRRRYRPESLRAAFAGSGLGEPAIFWWGEWLAKRWADLADTPAIPAGRTAWRTYRRYLVLPPWPATLAIRAMFRREQSRGARRPAERSATSLFAVGPEGRAGRGRFAAYSDPPRPRRRPCVPEDRARSRSRPRARARAPIGIGRDADFAPGRQGRGARTLRVASPCNAPLRLGPLGRVARRDLGRPADRFHPDLAAVPALAADASSAPRARPGHAGVEVDPGESSGRRTAVTWRSASGGPSRSDPRRPVADPSTIT